MQSTTLKAVLKTTVLAVAVLLLTAGASFAQSVNLTAAPTTATLPDGQVVPMWGYTCTGTPVTATCAASNPTALAGTWSPVVITVPPGPLTINLTNSLSFGANSVPTSLMIVGQLGGGLGGAPTKTASPTHAPGVVSWPIAGANPPAPGDPTFNAPSQLGRVQSFGTEVAAGATTALLWTGLKPGTYLIESGTHPSIQGPMGLYGVLVVTTAPSGVTPGTAYTGVTYDKEVSVLLSEIDPLQNTTVSKAVNTAGFSETTVWSGQPGQCGNSTSANYLTCYPPVVNYDPRYYLINGVAFDRTHAANSVFAATGDTATTGTVLVRFVNAGLRMHVPSIVGSVTGASAVSGFSLIAEDGNVLPGVPRIQNEVLLPAGKVYDVMVNQPAAGTDFPVFDRQLSLSTNNQRDGGMQAYINVNGGVLPASGAFATAVANPDTYSLVAGTTLSVSDPGKGVIANDIGVYGVTLAPATVLKAGSTLTLNPDGTFTYVPGAGVTSDTFTYVANGNPALTATVTLGACTGTCLGGVPVANPDAYTSAIASRLHIGAPGVLANDTDPAGHPLKAVPTGSATGGTVTLNADGSFTVVPTTPPTGITTATVTFQYNAVNSQKTSSATPATVTVTFNGGSGLAVHVFDAPTYQVNPASAVELHDYRWIIEEDRTFNIDPACQVNSATRPAGCPALPVPSLGTNFHTSYMPLVAAGCVGTVACESGQTLINPLTGVHSPAVCDIGNGACEITAGQQTAVLPSQVHLDPTKRYYISILPGDAGNSFSSGSGAPVDLGGGNSRQFSIALDCPSGPGGADFAPGTGTCGHGMGGSPIAAAQTTVNVTLEETPFPPTKVAVFVFEDDFPLNGEADAGGGIDTLAINENGLGGFEITLFDDAGGTGDSTGQMTYDMFNMPLSNSLSGTPDPLHPGNDACPITSNPDHLVGMIFTCPHFESDGVTVSPLEGQAVVANLMPGRYSIVATPGADRIARGEEWLQTNTLDGQKAHDAFIKIGGPAYFQEFGPAGYHDIIGFANPKIINSRLPGVCAALQSTTGCQNSITGKVTDARMSRTPDQRLYGSGSRDALAFTQCYVSFGDPDAADIAFTKCDADGNFTLSGLPDGSWRLTIFDQWNDQIVDGLATPVALGPTHRNVNLGDVPVQQWHTNLSTSTFFDANGNGVRDANETGLALVPTNVRFRDGSYSNFNNTDLSGNAGFNEIFPLFNWYVLETDSTRYKQTGIHVVYDAGGAADCTTPAGVTPPPPCSNIAGNFASSTETFHLPTNLRVPGAVYCATADCTGASIKNGPGSSAANPSTGRIDPPWVSTEAWQGFIGQYEFVEFGKTPFAAGENGGIKGEVVYDSTRPFDDPAMNIHLSWTPNVPGVIMNLYQEGTAPDGTQSLKLVDTTVTTSWDNWAQGFRSDGVPNMNCPGQDPSSLFFFTLRNTTQWLSPTTPLPNNSQFKCYDGFAQFNQVQPAPVDGMYKFPSVTGINPTTGLPLGTNCTICVANPTGDGTMMLPAGKYVVETVLPPGYELVKEEDKNILIGDNYIAPVAQQFAGLGNIFILPDQAEVASQYNPNNAQNSTNNLGSIPRAEGDTGNIEQKWPCVGELRIVPDFISLFPLSQEVSPFAGASRHLCDRREINLEDQMSATAKFYVFSSTHVAAHFTGIILDDFSSEFDPFSPQYGEKFAVPNVPISFKDHLGVEVLRTYSDQWGLFNGLNYSTWEVNPPNPTGYAPTMMVTCMNDPGPIPDPLHPGQKITDPLYNPAYSQFCYEMPFMPGQTQYMDTPVVPTSGFAEGYNLPDCNYPDATPAIAKVTGDASGGGAGPWVSAPGHTLTITALGDQVVPNNAYSGPSATTAPYNQKFITRHYGFGTTQGTGSVTIGGANAPVSSWSDTTITVTVPSTGTLVPLCQPANQIAGSGHQLIYHGTDANDRCGELVITAGNGKKSIDAVTVTVGGTAPSYVNGENPTNNAIQTAIDNAAPGALIIVGPGVYNEMILMWKPVRLQGVGAASAQVNANAHPSGKLDPWRRQVICLFGASLDGDYISPTNPYDPNGIYTCPAAMQGQVDPLVGEPVVGWDPTLNGNIAELLSEPTLLGAYEGAGITVLSKGVVTPDPNCTNAAAPAPVCVPLTNTTGPNGDCTKWVSNFICNPARIDGISFVNSSQGGGGIFVHGWGHFLEVSNNRVKANAGTIAGGISIGSAESDPGAIAADGVTLLPGLLDTYLNVHNNSVTQNAAYGDELNSTTTMGAGGVTFCTGSDYYLFNFNWVCGNLSTGDGAGLVHYGVIYNGTVAHNTFLFNQSTNPTIPTNGGAILATGAPPDGPACDNNATVDVDCPPALSDGAGPNLVIDSNLIAGNTAESGSGGGIRLQSINGTEIALNATNPNAWYGVTVQNNIITNNVAGWDGGGISLQDALKVRIINNTIMSNDSTASAGVLFNTLGAPNANTPPPGCDPVVVPDCANSHVLLSLPIPAGLVTMANTPNMTASLPSPALPGGGITCPAGQPNCARFSNPLLQNNLFWHNRSFHITVGGLGTAPLNQQNTVSIVPQLNQPSAPAVTANGGGSIITGGTGACTTTGVNGTGNVVYWDIGVRGDTSPSNHSSGLTLAPTYSILTDAADYGPLATTHNVGADPAVASLYCNGSRVAPENGGLGYAVPPGISDATLPNPVFNLTPSATVDEGNNWVNMSYGPLSLTRPSGIPLGNYALTAGSPAIGVITPTTIVNYANAPSTDFFGFGRKNGSVDIGAIEFQSAPSFSLTPDPLALTAALGGNSGPQPVTLTNTGNAAITVSGVTITGTNNTQFSDVSGCTATIAVGASCTINVTFTPTGTLTTVRTAALNVTSPTAGTQSVQLTGTIVVPTLSYTVTPTTLPFANQVIGTTSAPLSVTVTNTSGAGGPALTINASTITGATAGSGFVVSATTCPASLPATGANTCTISVTFGPTTTGSKTGILNVNVGAPAVSTAVSLTGTAVAAGTLTYTVTPTTLPFANQPIGSTSGALSVTVTNTSGAGGASLTVNAPTITGATAGSGFVISANTCPASLPPTGTTTCTISVTFGPTTTGAKLGTLNVNVAAPATSTAVSLTGTATAASGIVLVQSNSGENNPITTSVTSLAVPFTGANTAGNMIIAFVRMSTTGQTVTVADTRGNTYTDAVSQAQANDGSQIHIFYARNITAGANTVTATFSAANAHPWLAIYEYSGVNTLDRTQSAQGSSAAPSSGATLATTSANELVFGGVGLPSSFAGTPTAGATFAILRTQTGVNNSNAANESKLVTATGTQTATFGLTASANWSAAVATFSAGVSITTTSLPAATQNVAYTTTLAATGGTTPYTWSIASGTLPTGLTLATNTGVISGTPTVAGTSNFTVRVTDVNALTTTQALSITVAAPLTITTTSLPTATQNTAYTTTLAATGGTTPYTWSISIGALPTGLTLAPATGVISGTPTVAGTVNFTVRVTDVNALTTTQALSITVNPGGAPTITTTSLPGATQNTAYTTTVAATGGTTPYTWSISVGTLPTGLAIAPATGVISGTPTVAGTVNFTVRVTGANTLFAEQALSITVAAPLAITTTTLPAGTQNTAYTTTLAATGGTAPTTWSISAGTLPAGLTLAPATGIISGTPSVAATTAFTVRVTDANLATTTQALSITINPSVISLAQSNTSSGSATGLTSVPVAFTSTNTAGNLIIAFVRMSTTNQTVTVADTRGNVYTQATQALQAADGSQVHIFYAPNIGAGLNTVTATFSAANNHPWLAIYEYHGLSLTAPLDQVASATGNTIAPSTGGTPATTSANELVFAAFGLPASYTGTQAAGTGFAILNNVVNTGTTQISVAATESRLATVTGAQTGTFNLGAVAQWSAIVATFKP